MKIAFIGSRGVPARYGDFETATEEIGRRLAERGHQVTVYCRPGNGDASETVYKGMRKIYVPCVKKKSLETLTHTAVALIHAAFRSYDVLIIMNPANGPLCIIPRLRRTPFALHVDGLDWERSRWPKFGRAFIRFGAWCSTKLAPALIADSRGIQDFYRTTWNRETVYAAYGADIQEPRSAARLHELGLESRGYLLVVARLEPENHTDLIVQAYKNMDTDLPLVIVGDTNYASDYINALKKSESESIRFLGGVYDADLLETLLQHCQVYLHGHSVGGTNPVLLQAMAASCAIVCLNVSFNGEVVGNTALTFEPDAGSLESTLSDLLENPAPLETFRGEARSRVETLYTWEAVTDAYENLCEQLRTGSNPDNSS
jgi:glycosyltransferase involved in cell wall biosynthesis